jgi:RNA polymerase sigma-70 factor (ECF subfamily)
VGEGNTFIAKHHPPQLEQHEAVTLASLRNGDESAFEKVFKENFKSLYGYAIGLVKNDSAAEEIVQNVFFKIWKKKEQLPPSGLLKAYLYRAVHNESLNLIKHHRVRTSYQMHAVRSGEGYAENASAKVSMAELQRHLSEAMNCLPEQCRTIFQMSRFEEKKCKEIAEELQIAPKTVENQLGKALKILRVKLKDFLPAFVYLFINLKP